MPRRWSDPLIAFSMFLCSVGVMSLAAVSLHGLTGADRGQPSAGCWKSVFDGFGENVLEDGTLHLRPQGPRSADETHASLVVSTTTFEAVDFETRVMTSKQLRSPVPNPWEVAWVVWSYSDPTHFYYLILKPHGWELGKADPTRPGRQRFLKTGTSRVFPTGRWYSVHVRQHGATMHVTVDGEPLTTFTDRHSPYRGGKVGFYVEDAEAAFRPALATRLCRP